MTREAKRNIIRAAAAIISLMLLSLFLIAHTGNQANAAVNPTPDIPGSLYWALDNYDYSQPVGWDTYQNQGPSNGTTMYGWTWYGGTEARRYFVHSGTNQRYDLIDASGNYTGLCPAWNNTLSYLQFQTCGSGTWQQWRSEKTSHGWLIWSTWFANAYPNWCASVGWSGYEAVVTVDQLDGQMHLACPEGYQGNGAPWGLGQYWAADSEPAP